MKQKAAVVPEDPRAEHHRDHRLAHRPPPTDLDAPEKLVPPRAAAQAGATGPFDSRTRERDHPRRDHAPSSCRPGFHASGYRAEDVDHIAGDEIIPALEDLGELP